MRIGKSASQVETASHVVIEITDLADINEAQSVSIDLARLVAVDDSVAERAAFIASEAAANILRHAGAGRLLMRVTREASPAVEIIATDRGPGIAHLSAAMHGGYSTSGDSGMGLCAMSRAANLFDIYSRFGQGTALMAQVWARRSEYYAARDYARPRIKSGVVSTAKPESKAGILTISDAWAAKHQPSRSLVMLANGLGQGAEAARAASEAAKVIDRIHALSPAEIIEIVHEALNGTRGASVAVAEIRLLGAEPEVRFAGVGNIAARVVDGGKIRHLTSVNGIAGYEAEIRQFTYAWPAQATLVMHSDGVLAQWDATDYPGLLASHPTLIAAVLHRDFNCALDDATVIVAKH
jgi:anti-sigma regulatory factor (Ser/Thr protein kinase)